MIAGARFTRPILCYIVAAIVAVSLLFLLYESTHHHTLSPNSPPMHNPK